MQKSLSNILVSLFDKVLKKRSNITKAEMDYGSSMGEVITVTI